MPLKDCGEATIAKSGKSLKVKLELPGTIFSNYVFINLERLKKVLDGKEYKANVVTVVHESRVSEKFDL